MPSPAAEERTPRRSARKAELSTAQRACLAYSEARRVRGLEQQSHGEGALAAAAAAAARERPASAPGKSSRRRGRVQSVEGFFLCAATEARPRVRAHAVAAVPRRLFRAQADEQPGEARAETAGRAFEQARLQVSLRVNDRDDAVLCDLRLAVQEGGVDELTAALASGLRLSDASAAAEVVPPARLARLRAPALTPEQQRLSYLGFCAPLRSYLAARGANTLSTAAARRWLTMAPEGIELTARVCAAHGVEDFSCLQVRAALPSTPSEAHSSSDARGRSTTSSALVSLARTTPSITFSCREHSMPASTPTVRELFRCSSRSVLAIFCSADDAACR